jgi:hypothetical protein
MVGHLQTVYQPLRDQGYFFPYTWRHFGAAGGGQGRCTAPGVVTGVVQGAACAAGALTPANTAPMIAVAAARRPPRAFQFPLT